MRVGICTELAQAAGCCPSLVRRDSDVITLFVAPAHLFRSNLLKIKEWLHSGTGFEQ